MTQRTFAFAFKPLAVLTVFFSLPALAATESPLGPSLVTALRQGGYVLVMRHPSSPPTPPEKASADPVNTQLERQLDEVGRNTARAMGQAIRDLHIPIGTVLTSPTFRARQAIELFALGEATVVSELGEGEQGMMATADATRSEWLRKKSSESPPSGTNTLIVTHTPNLAGAFGERAKGVAAGETLVFRPNGKGQVDLVTRVKIEEWPKLLEASRSN